MNLEDKAVELLTKMDAVATQVTPEALELAKTTMQVSGAKGLLAGFIALTIFILTSRFSYKTWKKDRVTEEEGALVVICAIVAFMSVAGILCELCDIWNWVAVFRPDVAMAHKVLKF